MTRQEEIRSKMSDSTRLTLIDKIVRSIENDDMNEIEAAERLLRLKCFQSKISVLHFLMFEIFCLKAVPSVSFGKTILVDAKDIGASICPFCGQPANGTVGLKAHFGRMHKDKKSEWSGKY